MWPHVSEHVPRREAPREAPLPRIGSDTKICMTEGSWTDASSNWKRVMEL